MSRRGLVLGAGGALGFAWMVGALSVLEESEGFDARTAEVLVGTSAGSVLAALLGSGVDVAAIQRHQLGEAAPGDPAFDESAAVGRVPRLPHPWVGSPALAARAALHPGRYPALTVLTSLLPRGRGSLAQLSAVIRAAGGEEWAGHRATWCVAMDYRTGGRVAFGRAGAPAASLADAVAASCAVPGWYEPVLVGGRCYVDGGACSPVSADLLAGLPLDEVTVLAPMASLAYDEPAGVPARLERQLRRGATRRVLGEVAALRAGGLPVRLLTPGPEDLRAFGANLMDGRRRSVVLDTSIRTTTAALAG